MIIPKLNSQLQSYTNTYKAQSSSNNFKEILKKKTKESNINSDAINISNPVKKFHSADGNVRVNWPNINDKPISIGDALNQLTEEQVTTLNEKYNMKDITPYSTEYNALMEELQGLGVISSLPSSIPLGAFGFNFDENGNVNSFFTKIDEPSTSNSLIDWFSASTDQYSKKYEETLGSSSLSDKLFLNLYTSQNNIGSVIEEIFGRQVNLKNENINCK